MSQTTENSVAITPGPWIVEARPGGLQIIGHSATDAVRLWLAEVWSGEADARLIAAAPSLLFALREILEDPDAKLLDTDREVGWEAIAKATGR